MAIYPVPGWNQPLPEWLSLQQAAALYGVSVDTLRRRIAAGRLPASRFGERLIRVRAEDLDRLFRPIPTGDWPCAVGPARHPDGPCINSSRSTIPTS